MRGIFLRYIEDLRLLSFKFFFDYLLHWILSYYQSLCQVVLN